MSDEPPYWAGSSGDAFTDDDDERNEDAPTSADRLFSARMHDEFLAAAARLGIETG